MPMHLDHDILDTTQEQSRLDALRSYRILDTLPETDYDDYTTLASRLIGTPIALISFIDANRQWFKSKVGLEIHETPRAWAFCEHAIRHHDLLVVEDATRDPVFRNNPLVTAEPRIRFYAGCPLITPDGHALGTLCVIGQQPRALDTQEADTLRRLGRQLVHVLEERRLRAQQDDIRQLLDQRNTELKRLAMVAENTTNVVTLCDPTGRITWVNPAFARVTGHTPSEVMGRLPADMLQCEDTDPDAARTLRQALAQQSSARVQLLNRRKDGEAYWVDVDLQPHIDEGGNLLGFVSIETDITEHIRQQEHWHTLLEALPDGLLTFSAQGEPTYANKAAWRWLQWPDAVPSGPVPSEIDERVRQCLHQGQGMGEQVIAVTLPNQMLRWIHLSVALLPGVDGQHEGAVALFSDQTERVEAGRYIDVANATLDIGYWTWHLPTDALAVSSAWSERMRLYATQFNTRDLVHPEDQALSRQRIRELLVGRTHTLQFEVRMRFGTDDWRWMLCGGTVTQRSPDGRVVRLSGILLDIHARKVLEHALHVSATTDTLTQLPNRQVLEDLLAQAMKSADEHQRCGALLLLDLDHFKRVNDTYGHAVGDALLVKMSHRLRTLLSGDQTLARMGGDELLVLLPELPPHLDEASMQAMEVANRLLHALDSPVELDGLSITLGASIGIALFPKSREETPHDVVREADTAMYSVKGTGRGGARVFEASMRQSVSSRLQLDMDLREALEQGQFALYLQGKWAPEGRWTGAEALIRWHHPLRGAISPAAFIPAVEDSQLIIPLGRWILNEACAIAKACRRQQPHFVVSVNVSPRQFQHAAFSDDLRGALQTADLPNDAIMIEITEGVLLQPHLSELIVSLSQEGFRFSLDDFGTGYSSLAYLKRVPVHELKIDRAFVRDIETDANDAALVQAILSIANQFGIDSVAEGVEKATQADWLHRNGCTLMQGFLYARPMPWRDFIEQHLS